MLLSNGRDIHWGWNLKQWRETKTQICWVWLTAKWRGKEKSEKKKTKRTKQNKQKKGEINIPFPPARWCRQMQLLFLSSALARTVVTACCPAPLPLLRHLPSFLLYLEDDFFFPTAKVKQSGQCRKEMVGNDSKSSEKLRETLADIEGPVVSVSSTKKNESTCSV